MICNIGWVSRKDSECFRDSYCNREMNNILAAISVLVDIFKMINCSHMTYIISRCPTIVKDKVKCLLKVFHPWRTHAFYLFLFIYSCNNCESYISLFFTKELAIGTYNFFIPVIHSRHNLLYFIYMYTIFFGASWSKLRIIIAVKVSVSVHSYKGSYSQQFLANESPCSPPHHC